MVKQKKVITIFMGFFIFFLLITTTGLKLILPYLLSEFINSFGTGIGQRLGIIKNFSLIVLFLLPLSVLLKFLLETYSWNIINHLRISLVQSFLNRNQTFFNEYTTGNLLEYYEVDINKIYYLLTISLPNLIKSLSIIAIILFVFIKQSILLLLFFMIYVFCCSFITKIYVKNKQKVLLDESNYHEDITGKYGQWLDMKDSLHFLKMESGIINEFDVLLNKLLAYKIDSNKFHYTLWCITLGMNIIADIFILGMSGFLFEKGVIDVGLVYLYYSYNKKLQSPLETLQQQVQSCLKGIYSYKRIRQIFHIEKEQNKQQLKEYIGRVEIEGLSFFYDDKLILENVSLIMEKGDVIGIHGVSGDGKSTLCKLLSKQLFSTDGKILINNIDINSIDNINYYKKAAYITNSPFLLNDSLYRNMCLYSKETSLKEAEAICEENGLYKYFYDILGDSTLDAIVDVNKLSLGQKQMLAFMRLFFYNKQLIVIDEGLSNVEGIIADEILGKLIKHNKDAIYLLVTHNVERMKLCSRRYVMQKGKIYEQ